MKTNSLFGEVVTRYGRIALFANDVGAITQSLQAYGEWAENELGFIKNFLPVGGTVVDVGGYIGTHTLAFSRYVGPSGKVITFEPQQATFKLLKKNVAANDAKNVHLINAAAAEQDGTLEALSVDPRQKASFGSASLFSPSEWPMSIVTRKASPRSSFVPSTPLDSPNAR